MIEEEGTQQEDTRIRDKPDIGLYTLFAESCGMIFSEGDSHCHGDDFTGNSSGGGYTSTGGPGDVTGDTTHPVSYTATPAVAKKLGTIDATTHAWTTNSDNQWFDLTYIPGTGNYSVSWRTGVATTSDIAQAAAAKLIELEAYEARVQFFRALVASVPQSSTSSVQSLF